MPKKTGRPRLPRAQNLDENQGAGGTGVALPANYRGVKRNVSINLMNRIRERADPDLFIDSLIQICMGNVPLWIDDKRAPSGVRVIPDPNPLLPSPTLQQRLDAQRELMNRGWGMAPQHVKVDVEHHETLPLQGVNLELLDKLNQLFLESAKPQLTNITDAELVDPEPELQEPGQVAEGTLAGELQEAYQSHGGAEKLQALGQVFAQIAELIISTNENSVPGDDPSTP